MHKVAWILVVVVLALIIDMPATLKIQGQTFYRPRIDFNFLGRRVLRDLEIKLGLDLQGGTHLVYQADTDKPEAIEAARQNIEKRVNLLGVAESIVQTSKVGDRYRLIVELPGVKDINQALATIGQTAQLEFRETLSASPTAQLEFVRTGLTGQDLRLAQLQFGGSKNQPGSQPTVGIEFTPEGTKKFAEITQRNIGKPLAIFLDEQIITAPTVQDVISDGRAVISGNFTSEAAKTLVIQLNAGALPVPIKIIEQRNIGATLGEASVRQSLVAGGVGLGIVWLFMIVNYGWRGLLADVALVVYVLVSLALIKLIPITLTLAGIAGFVLSIGMAADANILIFERIKEELKWGRPKSAALELGFHRAWNSIRDSNISSLITAGILFWFGGGAIRGFALTLAVGVAVSLFSAITVTRTLLKLWPS